MITFPREYTEHTVGLGDDAFQRRITELPSVTWRQSATLRHARPQYSSTFTYFYSFTLSKIFTYFYSLA